MMWRDELKVIFDGDPLDDRTGPVEAVLVRHHAIRQAGVVAVVGDVGGHDVNQAAKEGKYSRTFNNFLVKFN